MQPRTLQKGRESQEKLILAVLSGWELEGAAGISARNLASSTGLPVASIYHHFGDLEHLFESAQDDAKRAAEHWCDQQLDMIRGATGGARALGSLLATLIDDWCEKQRTFAFAWRQSQLASLRDANRRASRAQWSALWQAFWREICGRLDLIDIASATTWLFEGVAALHLLRWRRALDRAALDELCKGWADWLDGRLAGSSPWFELARREAAAIADTRKPTWPDLGTENLANAAARTIERHGVERLTHRAVAMEAGVTLGVVSYRFRTSADLVDAAFEAIYSQITLQSGSVEALPGMNRKDALDLLQAAYPARQHLLGIEELVVAASRDTAINCFGAQLRYLRGRSSGRHLQAVVGPERPIAPIDGAIFSALLSGRGNDHLHGERALDRTDLMPLFARLGVDV